MDVLFWISFRRGLSGKSCFLNELIERDIKTYKSNFTLLHIVKIPITFDGNLTHGLIETLNIECTIRL